MFDLLKTYFSKGITSYALEVYQIDESISFRLLEVKRKKGELDITDSQTFNDLGHISKFAKNATPIYVVYNAADVITKTLEIKSKYEGRAAVENKFPGLNLDNFYFQISKLKNQSVISVVKKSTIGAYLEQLQELKFSVVGFSLGACSLRTILDYLNKDVVFTNSEEIRLPQNSGNEIAITKTKSIQPSTYNINGLNVENSALLAFSGVLEFLFNSVDTDSNFGAIVKSLRRAFENKRVFYILLRSSLAFILILLLVNFLFFNFYFNNVQSLKDNLSYSTTNKNSLLVMQQKVAEKEKKVDAVLSVSNSKASFYLDKIGATVPSSILLTRLLYQPFKKPPQESKPIELLEHKIMVMGTSTNSEDFSLWLTQLETFEWVKSIETKDFDYKSRNSSNFKIQINAIGF
ncbi:hypothetical protein [Flagellimonas sp. S3867]|uniref:hypothetical protein n=1 Tax=Flagellimonas sp. S3867 TaxID=2768063 RepID=UPI0016861C4E|nr:hypothetical protein [Flagellimonas sp. S3867]